VEAVDLKCFAAGAGVGVDGADASSVGGDVFFAGLSAGCDVAVAEAIALEGFVAGADGGVGGAEASSAGADLFFEASSAGGGVAAVEATDSDGFVAGAGVGTDFAVIMARNSFLEAISAGSGVAGMETVVESVAETVVDAVDSVGSLDAPVLNCAAAGAGVGVGFGEAVSKTLSAKEIRGVLDSGPGDEVPAMVFLRFEDGDGDGEAVTWATMAATVDIFGILSIGAGGGVEVRDTVGEFAVFDAS